MIDPSDPDILRPLPSLRGLIRAGGRLYQPWRFCTLTDDLNEAAFFALSPKVARSGLSPRHRTPGGDDVRGDGLCPGGRLPRSPAEVSRSIWPRVRCAKGRDAVEPDCRRGFCTRRTWDVETEEMSGE